MIQGQDTAPSWGSILVSGVSGLAEHFGQRPAQSGD
jgi:hypothetical protein